MTAVDNTVQRRLKFKITSKGIRDVSDQKSCENIVTAIINNDYKNEQEVTGVRKKVSKVNISVKPYMSTNSCKRRPEACLDGQREKRQKMDHCVKQLCRNILKTLMIHSVGCYFSEPVDPVRLNIPDYFSIITEPMDLGTIKRKLDGNLNYGAEAFAADVRLTFSNAMLYNPPGNCFHKFAKELDEIFCKRWRTLEAKLKSGGKNIGLDNCIDKIHKNCQDSNVIAKKNGLDSRKIGLNKVISRTDFVTQRPMSLEEKRKLKLEFLEISSRKLTNYQAAFQKFDLIDVNGDKLDSFLDAAKDETLWKLRTAVNSFSEARVEKVEVEPAKMGLGGCPVVSKSVRKAKCSSCGSLACYCKRKIACAQVSSSDITSERSSEPDHLGDSKFECKEKQHLQSHTDRLGPNFDGFVVTVEGNSPHSSTPETSVSDDGWLSTNILMSPKKALRAAMLKSRFADTIFRATKHTLLEHGEKSDPVRVQHEKERLIKQQLEEKTRIEAEIKAAEDASRMRREREREAARMELQKMEKTVEIYENQETLKYVEMLSHDSLTDFPCREGSEVSLGVIQGSNHSGNFLERLGLYIKDDYFDEEDEGEIMCREEGEILS